MKQRTVTAFCPGHISGYFRRIEGDIGRHYGKYGAGIVISEGSNGNSCSQRIPYRFLLNRKDETGNLIHHSPKSPPIEYVLGKLGVTVSVTTECHLPIGAGFGLSAAALLATLTAVNRADPGLVPSRYRCTGP